MGWTLSGDYYVDAVAGDDGNAGTSTAPFKTIPAAVAAAEAGGSGYQDIVVGAGTYTDRIVAGTTTDYLCLKADGEVIFDASSTGESAFYNGNLWRVEGFKIIDVEAALQQSSNDAYRVNYHKCYIKNCPDWYIDLVFQDASRYHDTSCIFENCRSTATGTSHYARNWQFSNCFFIDSTLPGYSVAGQLLSSNTRPHFIASCLFHNTLPANGVINYNRNTTSTMIFTNNVFTNSARAKFSNTGTVLSGSALFDTLTTTTSTTLINNTVVTASFNIDISGSNMMSDAMFTLPGITSNRDYFENSNLGSTTRFAGTNNMATAYGYQNIASNPFHTAGGATWTNITSSIAGGLQISASTAPTGTIESAVIDQGSVKVIRQIKTSFTSTVLGATGISAHTASVDNKFPTRQTFEMRFGNAPDLSSTTYQIFDTDLPTYVDLNGSGSGDVTFHTSSFNLPSARYLQLKFTLRTNMTGSA